MNFQTQIPTSPGLNTDLRVSSFRLQSTKKHRHVICAKSYTVVLDIVEEDWRETRLVTSKNDNNNNILFITLFQLLQDYIKNIELENKGTGNPK